MTTAGQAIWWTTAGAVVSVAAVASYEHACALVWAHGDAEWKGRLVPLTVDGLIYASSMVILDSALRKVPVPSLARWPLSLGWRRRLRPTWRAASAMCHLVAAAWPAVALDGSYGLLVLSICSARALAGSAASPGAAGAPGPLQTPAAEAFAGEVAAARVPWRLMTRLVPSACSSCRCGFP